MIISPLGKYFYLSFLLALGPKLLGLDTLKLQKQTHVFDLLPLSQHGTGHGREKVEFKNISLLTSNSLGLDPDKFHYFTLSILNVDSASRQMLLFFHNAQLDSARYWLDHNGETVYTSPITGCNLPGSMRPTTHRTLSIPITLEPNLPYQLTFMVYGREFDIAITPQLIDPVYGIDFMWTDYVYIGLFLFVGICALVMSILFVYQTIGGVAYSKSEIGWFILYGFSGLFYLIATSGYGSLYLWGGLPWFEVNAAIFFGGLSCLGFIHLGRILLNIHENYPTLDVWLPRFAWTYVGISLLGFLHYFPLLFEGFYRQLIAVPYFGMMVTLMVFLWLTLQFIYKNGESRYYWILVFLLFHAAFYLLIVSIETNLITYHYKMHALINVFCYVPQLILCLVYVVHGYFQLQFNYNQRIESLRKQIIHELYDEMGESLTKMSMSCFLAKTTLPQHSIQSEKIQKIESEVLSAERNLRGLYFTSNETYKYVRQFMTYIESYFSEYWQESTMKVKFDLKGPPAKTMLDENVKSQLLMILKEINTNIAKHAMASEIHINFQSTADGKSYAISVADNGIGMNTTSTDLHTKGISGMHIRAASIKAKLQISSNGPKGTTISIIGPFNPA